MRRFVKFLLIFVLGVCAGWGTFGYFVNAMDVDLEKMINGDLEERVIQTEPIVTNLKDGSYARIRLAVVLSNKKGADELKKRSFQFKNQIIKHVSEIDGNTLRSQEEEVLDPLMLFLDHTLELGEPLGIYITEKVIQ